MDMECSAPVHYDAYVEVEIVDEEWLLIELPMEEVEVPPDTFTPVDDDDSTPLEDENEAFKWTDVNLSSIVSESAQV